MASYKDTERERLACLIDLHNEEDNKTNGGIWEELRRAILERDNYICQDCGVKAGTVHHTAYGEIMSKDLLSLCSQCHMRRHGLDPNLVRNGEEKRGLRKRIAELKQLVEAYDNHWLVPYMMSREYWEKYRRPYYIGQIKEMENRLKELAK